MNGKSAKRFSHFCHQKFCIFPSDILSKNIENRFNPVFSQEEATDFSTVSTSPNLPNLLGCQSPSHLNMSLKQMKFSVAIICLVISKLLACVIQNFWQQKIQTKSKQQFHEK